MLLSGEYDICGLSNWVADDGDEGISNKWRFGSPGCAMECDVVCGMWCSHTWMIVGKVLQEKSWDKRKEEGVVPRKK
ncbi:hypothetical protein KQX54_017455 [Cotesia glomerata]|uniref:Uncharacterized protein n=1 Tax=Cotesia glomerata TaxID=32391 RepID=A0AAV7HZZ2_COTGL|nr:hypothetical protein KQX54_017455 [Cotesia glomerata]